MRTPLQLDIWLKSYAGFDNAKNNIKQRNLNPVFHQYLKNNISDIRLIPLDHVTYAVVGFTLNYSLSWLLYVTSEHICPLPLPCNKNLPS